MKPSPLECLALVFSLLALPVHADEPPAKLEPFVVTGTNTLVEETLFGPNQQPEWTAHRRFTNARVYVLPPWQVETEFGYEARFRRGEAPLSKLTQEIEVGLPYRFQLDYEAVEKIQSGEAWYDSSSIEARWALAEWGRIPWNPTIKAEWKINNDDADAYEFSLSLGDKIVSRWHWGAELFYEQQVGGDREREYAGSLALSYSVIDEKLGIGLESKLADEGDKDQHNPEWSLVIGPSLQWRPSPRTHLDIAPLFGVTGQSPHMQVFVFFGIDFGPGAESEEALHPVSLRNK